MTQQSTPVKGNRENTRRDFLKKSGMAGAFATLPMFDLREGDRSKSDLKQGKKTVVDLKINHPAASDRIPRVSPANAVPNTYTHKNRLFLLRVDPAELRGPHNALLRSPLNITRFSDQTGFQQTETLYQQSDYDGKSVTQLQPVEGYTPFTFDVKMEGGTAVVSQDGNQVLRVSPESEATQGLSEQTVTVKKYGDPVEREIKRPGHEGTYTVRPVVGTEKTTVTPELTVRNNGTLELFGAPKVAVIPDIPEYPILGILKGNIAADNMKVESVPNSDLFVVHRDYDHGPLFGQRRCQ